MQLLRINAERFHQTGSGFRIRRRAVHVLRAAIGEQDYSLGLQNLQTPLTTVLPPFTYYGIAPSVNFPLDLFGGTKRSIERIALWRAAVAVC